MGKRGVSIVAIGDEVLYGYTVNSNAAYIATQLLSRGVFPVRHVVVPDVLDDIEQIVRQELEAGRDVITIGGLGPTVDDLTRQAVAKLFHCPLILSEPVLHDLIQRYGDGFPTISDQSLQPDGATIFLNHVGTAPGLVLEDFSLFREARLFVMPGPPDELHDIAAQIIPSYFSEGISPTSILRLISLAEHDIDPTLRKLHQQFPKLRIGIYPSYGIVRVHLSGEEVEEASRIFCAAFGRFILTDPSLEEAVLRLLQERGWSIATAESCTAGGLAARIGSVPGASEVLLGGVVAYSTGAKQEVLHVLSEAIQKYGVVSTEVTEMMAKEAQSLFRADVVCSVSGYFGPGGGTKKSPVGTVCATFVMPSQTVSQTFFFKGTREAICEKTLQTLLAKLAVLLQASASGYI